MKTHVNTKNGSRMFTPPLFITAEKCTSTGEMIKHTVWFFHMMEYHSVKKKSKILKHATIRMILKNMLSERRQMQKTTYCTVLFI